MLPQAVGRGCGLDLALLWLWRRLAAAVPIHPPAQKLPCAAGAAGKKKKKKRYAEILIPGARKCDFF